MRTRPIGMAVIMWMIYTAFPAQPLSAQECIGLPVQRASLSFGLEGTDGASGGSAGVMIRSGSVHLGLTHASLDKFAQVDHIANTGLQVAWRWTGGAEVCGVAAADWTRYEDGPGVQSTAVEYVSTGDYTRIRTPLGISVGHELWEGHRVGVTPFLTLAMVYDYERMRLAAGGVDTRGSFGPGTTFGFTTRFGRVLLRSQVANAWTEDRALSNHNNHWNLLLHLGWAF